MLRNLSINVYSDTMLEFLNEVLSLNAQEFEGLARAGAAEHSSMKS